MLKKDLKQQLNTIAEYEARFTFQNKENLRSIPVNNFTLVEDPNRPVLAEKNLLNYVNLPKGKNPLTQ